MTTSIRADLDATVHVKPEEFDWVPSPMAGVERVMLDRVGDETAVATSIVRYAPGSSFSAHRHDLGEEYIVLDGEFGDEHGRYPVGSYVRNPPGSSHTPFAEPGCEIFVKLRQFHEKDKVTSVQVLSLEVPEQGVIHKTLFDAEGEVVQWLRIAPGERVAMSASYCAQELLVFSGSVTWQQAHTHVLGAKGWIRVAPGFPLRVVALEPVLALTKTRPDFRRERLPKVST